MFEKAALGIEQHEGLFCFWIIEDAFNETDRLLPPTCK
jgi:hypothetical protein